MKVYLDNAATTQISEEVQQLLIEINKSNYANPSSTHSFGRETRIIIENARKSIANYLIQFQVVFFLLLVELSLITWL